MEEYTWTMTFLSSTTSTGDHFLRIRNQPCSKKRFQVSQLWICIGLAGRGVDWEHAFDGTPGCKVMMMMDTRVQGGKSFLKQLSIKIPGDTECNVFYYMFHTRTFKLSWQVKHKTHQKAKFTTKLNLTLNLRFLTEFLETYKLFRPDIWY